MITERELNILKELLVKYKSSELFDLPSLQVYTKGTKVNTKRIVNQLGK